MCTIEAGFVDIGDIFLEAGAGPSISFIENY
jgi:hypothetical protein